MKAVEKRQTRTAGEVLTEYGALIALLVLVIINLFITKNFFSLRTLWNLLSQSTTIIILGLGMTVVIATGGINIAVGSMMALTGVITAKLVLAGYIWEGVLCGLLVAVLAGILTGYIVIKYNVQAMITSLSFMFILRGIAKLLNNGCIVTYKNKAFSNFFYKNIFGQIPLRFFIWLILAFLLWVLLQKTRFGIYVQAYGDNPQATRISGVNTVFAVTLCYAICNLYAGIAGLVDIGISTSADPAQMGLTKEMDAIAATVVGGTPIVGGKPNVWGTVFGGLVLQLITIMVNMNNVPYAYSRVLKAVIIIVAVFAQSVATKKNA